MVIIAQKQRQQKNNKKKNKPKLKLYKLTCFENIRRAASRGLERETLRIAALAATHYPELKRTLVIQKKKKLNISFSKFFLNISFDFLNVIFF